MSNFGGKPTSSKIDKYKSYKTLLFSSLLGSVIVWIAYRSFLSSELTVKITKYPFNDMESLTETNYL